MDTLDWLARNSEFLSTDSISNCLKEFKELYTSNSPKQRNMYITSRNQSVAVINVLQQIEHTTKLEPSDDTDYKISLLYSILEPLLINNYNLEKAVDMDIIEIIMASLRQSLHDLEQNNDPAIRSLIYQKYILRCLTSAMRNQRIVLTFLNDPENMESLLELIRIVRDEEILCKFQILY